MRTASSKIPDKISREITQPRKGLIALIAVLLWVFFITFVAPFILQLIPSAGLTIGETQLLPTQYYFWTMNPPGLKAGEGLPWLWWFLLMDFNLLMILVTSTLADHASLLGIPVIGKKMNQPVQGFFGLGLVLAISINSFPVLGYLLGAPHPMMTIYLFTVALVLNLTVAFGMNYDWTAERRKAMGSILFTWVMAYFLFVVFASDLYPNAGPVTKILMKSVFDAKLFGPASAEISLIWVEFLLWNLVVTLGVWNSCFRAWPFKKKGVKTGSVILIVSTVIALLVAWTWDAALGVPWGFNPASGLPQAVKSVYGSAAGAVWHWVRLTNIMWAAMLIGIGPSAAHIWHDYFSRKRSQPSAGFVNALTGFATVIVFFVFLWLVGSVVYPGWSWLSPLSDYPGYGGSALLRGPNPYMIMTLWIGGTTLQGHLWAYQQWNTWFQWWPFGHPKTSATA